MYQNISSYSRQLVIFFVCIFVFLFIFRTDIYAQAFTFGAAGDYANGSNAQATMNAAAANGVDFHLALGDNSYSPGAEASWCGKWITAGISNLMLIAGNHDAGEGTGGNIDNYATYCPRTIGISTTINGISSAYAKRYFFDYPTTNPVARFIMITPGIKGTQGNVHTYNTFTVGGEGYNFTAAAIDDARAKGIQWIIVGMHKNYISAMEKPDAIGNDIMNLLFSKKVDLVLQGHEHGYERTKQLKCATPGTFVANCVVDADSNMVKGAGTIIHIIGTGGQGLRGINTADTEYPYFASINNTAIGLGKFTITSTSMQYDFVRSAGGTLTDSFTITASNVTPISPSVTSSIPSPTNSVPSPTNSIPSPTNTALEADANNDGIVDIADMRVWLNNYVKLVTTGKFLGDFNRDGKVNALDLFVWTKYIIGSAPPSGSNFQPTAPFYSTFFYPWYENPTTDGKWSYWSDPPDGSSTNHTPPQNWFSNYIPDLNPTSFSPSTELYSSHDYNTYKWQVEKMKYARQEVAISSWWGQNHKTDSAFRKIITDFSKRADNPYPNLRWAWYYENEGFGDPTVAQITADLNYIGSQYANQPGVLKINGKPVMFVYGGAEDTATSGYHTRWNQANINSTTRFYIVLKVFSGYANVTPQPDSWHQYAPAVRYSAHAPHSAMVSPGFWLNGNAVRLPRDLADFQSAVSSMVAANATWKIVETWNEWGEGTSVEPGEQVLQTTSGTATLDPNGVPFKHAYLDALAQRLPPLESGSTVITTSITPTGSTPISQTDPVIAAVGDMVCGAGSTGAACKYMEVSDVVVNMQPTAFLALGDIQYEEGSLDDFNNFYHPSFGRVKNITKPVIGNHEYLTADGQGFFDYYNGVGNQTGLGGDRTKGYYAYDVGEWRLYALNSNCSKVGGCGTTSPQGVWLRNDLATNPRQCVLAYYHHPLHTSGSRASISVAPLFQTLYDAGAEVILAGHEHNYERFAPQDANGNLDMVRGIREFVNGSGGRNFTQFDHDEPNSESRNADTYGVLKLVLRPTSYEWQFVRSTHTGNGTFTDSGSDSCH